MARARLIKPGFFTNEQLGECPPLARILFAGLWTLADRDGRLEYRPKRFKVELLPYDECNVSELVVTLHDKKLLILYEVDSSRFIQICEFVKHQRPHPHEPKSVIPTVDQATTSEIVVTSNYKSLHDTSSCALPSFNPYGNTPIVPFKKKRTRQSARQRFTPPTIDDVRAYCLERKNGIDPEAFIAHYETVGWVYGPNRKPVTNWKYCVVTWEKRNRKASRLPTAEEDATWTPEGDGGVA